MPSITPHELLEDIRRHWRSSALILASFLCAGLAYFVFAQRIYRAEVTLIVKQDRDNSAVTGQFGGLAAIAGLGLANQSEHKVEALALLQSRIITNAFITEKNLLPVLFFSEWDAANSRWQHPSHEPSVWDAERLFSEKIRTISEDKRTGLITLSIDWLDPEIAAAWAAELVHRTNAYIRQNALLTSRSHLDFLEKKLAENNVLEVREAIYKLIEAEMKEYMLAQDESSYVLHIIDPPVIAKKPIAPKAIFVVLAALIAAITSILLLAIWRRVKLEP